MVECIKDTIIETAKKCKLKKVKRNGNNHLTPGLTKNVSAQKITYDT